MTSIGTAISVPGDLLGLYPFQSTLCRGRDFFCKQRAAITDMTIISLPNKQKVPPIVTEAAPGVWRVLLSWTLAYILSDGNDFALVDTGTRWDRPRLMEALATLNLDTTRCRSVLLTHGHCDHAGNAAFFAEQFGAKLHAHMDERPFVARRRTYVPRGARGLSPRGLMFALGEIFYPVRRRKIDVVLRDGDVVETPAGSWRVVHTPGHTPGHVSYFRESDATLLSGDALLNIVPFRRVDGLALPPSIFNTDTALVHRSAHRVAELAPRVLLPGHGRPLRDDTAARINAFVAGV
jgi:glyoxylase-like metal-dependent hydrolase (beta-lactamase superfamily II)